MDDALLQRFPAETTSESETRELGELFGRALAPGDVVALFGELGAGKTQFVKGICRAKDIDEELVSSPTFTIIHEYQGSVPVYHLDLYRIRSVEEALEAGVLEYIEMDGICLVEWPERIKTLLPEGSVGIRLSHADGNRRLIECSLNN